MLIRRILMTLLALPIGIALAQSPAGTNAGKYERITVHGTSLEGNLAGDSPDVRVSVYLPPGYAKNPRKRYPVLYLLHGFTSSDSSWYGLEGRNFIKVQDAVDRAYASGVPEMIVVTPNAFGKFEGSMYSSSATNGNWETFVVQELVAYIDKNYRTVPQRASRGLAGHSMGGYGTMRLGMKYPTVFSSLYAMSPCCMTGNLEPPVPFVEQAAKITTREGIAAADFFTKAILASAAAWSPNPTKPPLYIDLPVAEGKVVPSVVASWVANATLPTVHQHVPALKTYTAIALDSGDRDVPIVDTVRELDRVLTGYGVAHTSEVYSGDHLDGIEKRLETRVMPFFGKHLKAN